MSRTLLARLALLVTCLGLLALPEAGTASHRSRPASLADGVGPCTDLAARSMPEGPIFNARGEKVGEHDHLNIDQHRFRCRLLPVFVDPLTDELAAEPDVILGEIDIEVREDGMSLLAIAVAFPESGALFYDVTNPARPVFLSWFRSAKCEDVVVDVDCGAYIDLSEDGTVAFLSTQSISYVSQEPPDPGVRPVQEPGVEVLDVRDPSDPLLTQMYIHNPDGGGVHTSNSWVIPAENPVDPNEEGPRAPGEYLFSVSNVDAVHITRVNRIGGFPFLTEYSEIPLDELHDMFLDNDPLTGRTYLYVAGGFATGFYVYDVTDPANAELLGEWDPTPECGEDWYGHTTYTVVRNGHRFVTLDAEVFGGNGEFGEQDEEDKAEGCGKVETNPETGEEEGPFVGNGNLPGPLWIVDATDFSKLQPANDQDGEETGETAAQLKQNSLDALVTTWTNPANQEGGNIEFSPHNQQVVGNKIYLSHYHGGVYVLDATLAFQGRDVRPAELAFAVPHEAKPVRPIDESLILDPVIPFIREFFKARPTVWDALFHNGHFIAIDSTGGFYTYRERPLRTERPPRPERRR
ncbi:MAG TPA: hypothetical protein VHL78_05345 [Actinomycetota bacterium]|nr:hypothetical protein [Actinomycetota bacterium]